MQSSNPYLDRRQRFPTAYERMTARLHRLLQGVADASVCRHSPKGLPLLICVGFTPLAFAWPKASPARQQVDLITELPSPAFAGTEVP